jgi:hypothetical protein
MTAVVSTGAWYKAELTDADDGVAVVIYQDGRNRLRHPKGEPQWHQILAETIDVPMHVALNRIDDFVNRLPRERWHGAALSQIPKGENQ